jgi:uncharacterized membrane protein YhaH (DUF805 family)
MQITNQGSWTNSYVIGIVKSFLLWTFTLTVSFLVVGFPVVVIIMTIGALAAVVLQSIFPASALLLVTGTILGMTVLAILLSALALTLKGVHPQEVSWLRWLHGKDKPEHNPVNAACPLTCNLTNC